MKKWFASIIDKLNMRRRHIFTYVFCIMVPLMITDLVIIGVVYNSQKQATLHRMENVANSVRYTFNAQVDSAAQLAKGICTSRYIDDFINTEFESNLEYFSAYHEFFNDTLINIVDGANGLSYSFYVDNDTIINGSEFQKLEKAVDLDWYKYMREKELKRGLYFTYDNNLRRIYYFQRLNFFDKSSKNVVLISLDYGTLLRNLQNLNYDGTAYICDDEKILVCSGKSTSLGKPYAGIDSLTDITYSEDMGIYGLDLSIDVSPNKSSFASALSQWGAWVLLLTLINIMVPTIVVTYISRETIKEQEMVVARKNAELLALHSQINPHFLFNALESIRMHSLLRHEVETADMVEKLAKMQRQYTEWQNDFITIEDEVEFVMAYLSLQRYRFGERLSFDLDIDDECRHLLIPKLTLVTFVENACVHGIESKNTKGWIFVRASIEDDILTMEIEDTGSGMGEADRLLLLNKMREASIDMLKEKGRVGIVNACLRLKMISDSNVEFDIDAEEGIGTIIQIKIPVSYLKGNS